jgi:hypothetical protein
MALLPVAESMAAHESAIRKLIPHTMAHSSIHRACVRRVIHEELMCVERLSRDASAQEEQVTGAQESFLSQLITCMYAFDTPTGYPKEMEEQKRFDYFKSVDQLAENIDAMRDVPLRALRQLVRWCDLAHSALGTMANRGLIGLVVRPPYEALRRPVGSYDISIVVDGSDTERQEIQKMLIAEYPRNDLSQPLMRVLTSAQPVNSNMVLLNLEQMKVVIENMTVSAGVSD